MGWRSWDRIWVSMPRPWWRWLAARGRVGIDNGGGIGDGIGDAVDNDIMVDNEEEDVNATKTKVIVNKRKRRSYQERATKNILQDVSYIPDAERDELHVEIYKYLSWLHSKLADLSETACAATMLATVANSMNNNDGDDGHDNDDENNNPKMAAENKKVEFAQQLKDKKGVDVAELKGVLEKLKLSFAILPNIESDMTAAANEATTASTSTSAANDNNEVKEAQGEGAAIPTLPAMPIPQKGAPFLEEALSSALKELVLSREVAGKPKRRSRKRTVKKINNPRRMHDKTAKDWDTMFRELVEYKEEHGDCLVSKNHTDNKPVSN